MSHLSEFNLFVIQIRLRQSRLYQTSNLVGKFYKKAYTGVFFYFFLLNYSRMIQFSQTSWQEYTLANMLETMRYAPMNMTIGKTPVIHYTLPKALEAGEIVRYNVVVGFRKVSWTGRISAINNGKIMVRLDKGPFRGFNATHEFVDEGNLTGCYDEFSFQGFSEFPEEQFAKVMANASIVYDVASRKDARDAILAIESKKQTQGFTAIDQSATAG